ncbi:unnamed protein product [Vicia faba]|uniref:Uncharacterized protein n=1 Tax=Vicia faba TaxID=3906 RepID=A0AAV0Z9W5_VICFA|nr:unnamed protein product [Vicia faba]
MGKRAGHIAFGNNCEVEIHTETNSLREHATFMEKGIHFDDSEEERMHGFGDGVDEVQARTTRVVVDGAIISEPSNNAFIIEEIGREHIIEEDYTTDELKSGTTDDNCVDRPIVIRFNEEYALFKDFTFKVEIELSSLKQFKNFILEHNVLNGREVRFEKMMQIGDWVVKVILDRLNNNNKMKLNDVITDVRIRYAVEIPDCGAFKASQLTRKIVEGDSSKQYSLLWPYGAELRRSYREEEEM